MTIFYKELIQWYLQNKRKLPWRKTKDPYRIWLSEIILQQTRVEQGMPYYFKFVEAYPSVHDLARAEVDDVLKLWQGLGYYSRARNLHETAKKISFELEGKFPKTYKELKKLKGVGDYTASAIASICYNEPAAVVDGNVYRVLSRYYGIQTAINTSAAQKEFKAIAQDLIPVDDPATFNQAIMEFGATHCKPKNPYCLHCPLQEDCVALATNQVEKLPIKKGKIKVRERYFNYFIIHSNKRVLLYKRSDSDIWKGLYEFLLYESSKVLSQGVAYTHLKSVAPIALSLDKNKLTKINSEPIVHKLSHQKLKITFWSIPVDTLNEEESISITDIQSYALPRAIDRFLESYDFKS